MTSFRRKGSTPIPLVSLSVAFSLLGALCILLTITMIPSIVISIVDRYHPDRLGMIYSALLSFTIGITLVLRFRHRLKDIELTHKDGLFIVTLSWICCGLIGALPYYLFAHSSPNISCVEGVGIGVEFCSFTRSFFESMSGFTTTGASIIERGLWVEYKDGVGYLADHSLGLPRGILLWRSMTHFLGGMGIVVLSVAVLPLLGIGGMQLFKAEVPGPQADKIGPRVGQTALFLWVLYIGLTICCIGFYWGFSSLDLYESICHSMSTMATGGFSTRSLSIAGLSDPIMEWISILFMCIAGISFNVHYMAIVERKLFTYFKNIETLSYLSVTIVAVCLTSYAISKAGYADGIEESLRTASFQVVSLLTTTGYASADFELWVTAPLAIFALLLTFIIGGCSGSTGGGVKVVRHLILFKLWIREFFFIIHPTAKRSIRIDQRVVSPDVLRATVGFVTLYFFTMMLGCLLFLIDGQTLTTALTCSASSLGNIGPGFGDIGPYDNYATLSMFGQWVSIILMLLGRLELYTVLALFTTTFWKP